MVGDIVQSLWVGSRLSTMEQLVIRSFLACGHPFHLFAYGPLENVPEGTTLRDGREILPESDLFVYRKGAGKGSPSAVSNFFRYKMLYERGGWWADMDMVCLRPLDFETPHVVGLERERDTEGSLHVNCAFMRAPAGSKIAKFCWDKCQEFDKRKLRWGQAGPRMLARALAEVDEEVETLEPEGFYPIDFWKTPDFVGDAQLPEESYAVHLWNSQWAKNELDSDDDFPADCIYEQLKKRFNTPTLRDGAKNSLGSLTDETWTEKMVRRLKGPFGRRRAA